MTMIHKSPSVQSYRLLLYQRALHPELFGIHDRRQVQLPGYEMEGWIMPGGHVVRFQASGQVVSEIVLDHEAQLPQRCVLHSVPCLGEKEMEETVNGKIRYVTSVQTEQLTDNLFGATLTEMKDFAAESKALHVDWTDPEGGANLSVLDIQRYRTEIHVQSYHLAGGSGFVLRTQSIFEVL
jgi:hypothetical protein